MSTERTSRIRIVVIGAGLMGAGIAEVFARAGHQVQLVDERRGVAQQVANRLALPGLTPAETLTEALSGGCDLVVEAITESITAKADLLRVLATACPSVVVASNSSTYGPSELAPFAADPGRLLVAHFFNPATLVPLVEVVPSTETDPEVTAWVGALLREAGKSVVTLRREVPGFVANRLQAALLREALHLVEEGVVDAEELDAIVTSSIGARWSLTGPLRVADLGGLDVFAALCARLFPDLASGDRAPRLDALVAQGRLGAKSGEGIFSPAPNPTDAHTERLARIFELASDCLPPL